MKSSFVLSSVLLLSISATQAIAGTCEISYTRTACAGKEDISYKKCDGKQSCTKAVTVNTVDECRSKAVAACANDRLDITKSKVIAATFNGKSISNKAGGTDHCLDYAERAAEFNQCN